MKDSPLAKAQENASHMWKWVLTTFVLWLVFGALNTQMDEKYRGFWGGLRASNDPASVTQLALWIQAVVLVTFICFLVSCYKVYWRWVSRILVKHGTPTESKTEDRSA